MSTAAVTNTFTAGTTIVASQVNQNYTDLLTFLNTTGVNVYQAASVGGAALANDVMAVEKALIATYSFAGASQAAGSYILTGGNCTPSGTSVGAPEVWPIISIKASDYAVAGRTTKMQIRATVACNNIAPGTVSWAFGLFPITFSGTTANAITGTMGSVVAGSTATPTPTQSLATTASSGAFTIPADGTYTLGVVNTNGAAATTGTILSSFLQLSHA